MMHDEQGAMPVSNYVKYRQQLCHLANLLLCGNDNQTRAQLQLNKLQFVLTLLSPSLAPRRTYISP